MLLRVRRPGQCSLLAAWPCPLAKLASGSHRCGVFGIFGNSSNRSCCLNRTNNSHVCPWRTRDEHQQGAAMALGWWSPAAFSGASFHSPAGRVCRQGCARAGWEPAREPRAHGTCCSSASCLRASSFRWPEHLGHLAVPARSAAGGGPIDPQHLTNNGLIVSKD